jgi:hypothetical protein
MGPTAEDVTAGLDQLLVANTPASAGLRKALQQQQQQQRESASKSDTPSASRLSSDTAAHLDLQPSEQQQQQEEEEVPAEQHQQTSLEVCEEDAASAALQEEPALPELSPLQRLLLLCDQEPNVRSIPSMAALLKQVVPRLQQVRRTCIKASSPWRRSAPCCCNCIAVQRHIALGPIAEPHKELLR